MTDHRKWDEVRDEHLNTPEARADYLRAKHRLARHLRYYRHWERVKRRLGIGRRDA